MQKVFKQLQIWLFERFDIDTNFLDFHELAAMNPFLSGLTEQLPPSNIVFEKEFLQTKKPNGSIQELVASKQTILTKVRVNGLRTVS